MVRKEIKLPSTAKGWAIHLTKMLNMVSELHGTPRFPISIEKIAKDYSKSIYPEEPITLVSGNDFSKKFDGALLKNPSNNEWGIVYNNCISSGGRQNFTLAHELGHYLLHRSKISTDMFCSKDDMSNWDSEYGLMEAEANEFASYLLMPLDDFREQTKNFKRPTISDFEALSRRYEVSVTAAILKWLAITTSRARIIVSNSGFIDWAWSSKALLRSGDIIKPKHSVIEIPHNSLAANKNRDLLGKELVIMDRGVWSKREIVMESSLYNEYHDQTITLLIYPKTDPFEFSDD